MRRVVLTAFLLALGSSAAGQDQQQQADRSEPRFHDWRGELPQINCECRHMEGRAQLGETVCILQGSKRVTAQCRMVLNNPAWRVLRQDCDLPNS